MAYKWTNNAIATATSVASEDLILTVDDPSGTPVSKKITVANLIGSTDVISVIESNTNVTLAGSYDYLTISGQVITLGQIDLSTDVTGTLASGNIGSHTHVISDVTDFTDSSTNWNTAYGWGNHASAGYLTSSSTQSKYLRSDTSDSFTGNLTNNGNNHITFGPNSTWARYLRIGGNGYQGSTTIANIATTNGNLHLDAASGFNTYLNFYDGNNLYFGGGGNNIVASVNSSGTGSFVSINDYNNTAYYFDGSNTGDSIRVAGDIVAYYSDARLKDFQGRIDGALDKVLKINGYYYTENEKAKELGYNTGKTQVGVSAQEIEEVLPEVIKDAPIGHGYKTVQYERLVPLLIEAIKEQNDKIERLEAMVEKLINTNKG